MSSMHNSHVSTKSQEAGPILVIGHNPDTLASALQKLDAGRLICHAQTTNQVLELVKKNKFSHLLIDNRDDGPMALLAPRLAALKLFKVVVLAGPGNSENLHAVPGDITVCDAPYHPKAISIALAFEKEKRSKDRPFASRPVKQGKPAAPQVEEEVTAPSLPANEAQQDPASELARNLEQEVGNSDDLTPPPAANSQDPDKGEVPDLAYKLANFIARFISAIVNFLPGFTPVLSTIYKNLALTILAGLLFAFVSYGIMIAYFLTASDWSSPLQLSNGHTLVEKARRDLTQLEVRENYLHQQISQLDTQIAEAKDTERQADLLNDFTKGTLETEIDNRKQRIADISEQIDNISEVLREFGTRERRKLELDAVRRDYKNRMITRDSYDDARLKFLQTERDVTELFTQLSNLQLQHAQLSKSVVYMGSLKQSMKSGNKVINQLGGAEMVPVNNQVVQVTQMKDHAKTELSSALNERKPLANSLDKLQANIASLKASPLIRATEKPVNVLFVPYENMAGYKPGAPIYSCYLKIVVCSKVGTVGKHIPGEINIDHPFFGKPVRGQFVEADLSDPKSVEEGLLHVGRPPLFF